MRAGAECLLCGQDGLRYVWDKLNRERIESFLSHLDLYRENLERYPRQDNSVLFGRLDELIKKYT
jgi:hypothetical protein